MSSSVATALSDGLERLVEMSGAGGPGLGRESLPILESFLHATDLLVESAEAVGASTKEHRLREAIFNYGRELKAEANALREVAQGLAQAPAIGQTAETKHAMIRSLIKIGKLTANLMQAEEDVDQKVLSHACKNCASSAKARLAAAAAAAAAARGKTLVSKTRRTDAEMIEAARVFAQSCVELVKTLSDIAYRYAETSPKHRDEVLHVANQIKTTSPKLIEAVKVAHFNPGNTKNMEAALVVVKALAGEISRAITLAKGPAFTTEVRMPPFALGSSSSVSALSASLSSSPPSSSSSSSLHHPPLSSSPSSSSFSSLHSGSAPPSSPSTSRAGGGGLGGFRRRPEGGSGIGSSVALGSGGNSGIVGAGSMIRKRTITDSREGMDVLLRARAMSQAVTLKLKIEKELDVRSLDAGAAESEDSATASTAPVGDESANGGGKADHQHTNQGGKGRGSMDKEESKLLLRITKLEVDNKKLRDENEELRRRFENQADDERRLREREREEETELHEQLLLKRKLVSMADENSRLRQESFYFEDWATRLIGTPPTEMDLDGMKCSAVENSPQQPYKALR
ncbi:uncharacterized protein ACA1_197610 [Acanthamoeba castellanii str. Neff]|uniref:Uncharacterized protein n=1 Tax=Acanthamoeba castellanii (strain ATCC 30010 / Neff) TaxID=1257118 RepID=L8H586_ACACF|nr:uncharacterized protein ACA1_197610 [Acanthamoeba castellanii str. Neff]ELR19591.1 hypothetical protein ACA1_197610 [Acanthamoeba castellanii str. Neff]